MNRPNILLIMTDQQRGDCLGAEGHPCLLTPNLDELALKGMRFRHAYSTCPVCIPARRSLLSGLHPARHGLLCNAEDQEWNPRETLPQLLGDAGYQTQLVGRSMHQHPERKRFGYDEMVINPDYQAWLERHLPVETHHAPFVKYGGPSHATGIMHNDWTARPWPHAEDLHFTNWTMHEARRFLQRRDPACPFFLTISFLAPHPPLLPPAFYFDRYLRAECPPPVIGDWAEAPDGLVAVNSEKINLKEEAQRACMAGYYGSINHVDDQIRRLVYSIHAVPGFDLENTLIVFVSDHGEMLGDHHMFRKQVPYEGAARIPFIIRLPGTEKEGPRAQVSDLPVCLEDVMPTLLEAAGVKIPSGLDGRSLLPALRGAEPPSWREYLPIEIGGYPNAFHALTDGREKYIWFSQSGREQFFDLQGDPGERCDLANVPGHGDRVAAWRDRLVRHLADRPEGFVENGRLAAGRPHGKTTGPEP